MTPMLTMPSQQHSAGRVAALTGWHAENCPWPENCQQGRDWLSGWSQGMRELRERRPKIEYCDSSPGFQIRLPQGEIVMGPGGRGLTAAEAESALEFLEQQQATRVAAG